MEQGYYPRTLYTWVKEVHENGSRVPELSDYQARDHGGCRLTGLHGQSARDHDARSDKYLQASMWFQSEKEIDADQAPNPNPD